MMQIYRSAILFFIFLLSAQNSQAQDLNLNTQNYKNHALSIVRKLTSPDFNGRGYTYNGLEKTANFLIDEYKKIGLEKIDSSYYQSLTYAVNYIDNAFISINNKELKFGEDYLVGVASPSFKGKFKTVDFDINILDSICKYESFQLLEKEFLKYNTQATIFPPFRDSLFSQDPKFNLSSTYCMRKDIYYTIIYSLLNNHFQDSHISIPLMIEMSEAALSSGIYSEQWPVPQIIISDKIMDKYDISKIDSIDIDINTIYNPEFTSKNIIGKIKGRSSDSLIVISAHYDHLGQVNNVYFPGANDNASGVSFLLSLAKYFSKNKPAFDLIFICFTGEENNLTGSRYFISHPLIELDKIKLLINFDILGYGDEGIMVVNGEAFKSEFEKIKKINNKKYISEIKTRKNTCSSDHCPFFEIGIPSFYIYTLGGTDYHSINDQSEKLTFTAFEGLMKLFSEYLK